MTLVLQNAGCSCEKGEKWENEPEKKLPCKTTAKQLTLTCTKEMIQVGFPKEKKKPEMHPAWRCDFSEKDHGSDTDRKITGTRFPWVFGENRCLTWVGGPGKGLRYSLCE